MGNFFDDAVKSVTRVVKQAGTDAGNGVKAVTSGPSNLIHDINKGEIGKYTSNLLGSAYNLALAPARVVGAGLGIYNGGNVSEELQRGGGSFLDVSSAGTLGYAGQSSGIQKFLRDSGLDKYTFGLSTDAAALARGTRTTAQEGYLRNDDRNNIYQGAAKVAAAATVYYGGTAAYGYFAKGGAVAAETAAPAGPLASASAGAGGGSAVAVSTAGGAGGGALASASGGAAAGATATTAAAASTSTGIGTYLGYGAVAVTGAKLLTGKATGDQALRELYSSQTETPAGLWNSLSSLFSSNSSGTRAPASAPINYGEVAKSAAPAVAIIGVLAVTAFVLHKKKVF